MSKKNVIKRLYKILSKRRKIQFGSLVVLMVMASIMEGTTIAVSIPFLEMMTNRETLNNYTQYTNLKKYFAEYNGGDIQVIITVIFSAAVILSAGLRLFFLWLLTKISFETGVDLSVEIYEKTLHAEYLEHIERNSSEIVAAVYSKATDLVYLLIMPFLNIIASLVILIAITGSLMIVNSNFTLIAFTGLSLIYLIVQKITQNKLDRNSEVMSKYSVKVIQTLQEGMGAIRDVIIGNKHQAYINKYKRNVIPLRRAQASNSFIGGAPRYLAESIAITFIALMALYYTRNEIIENTLPLMGALALGAQRMLPLAQQIFGSIAAIRGGNKSLEDALDLLEKKYDIEKRENGEKEIIFNNNIEIKNIEYSYPNTEIKIINKLNLFIRKGEVFGIIGRSGGGKSTLLDILMGLIFAKEGCVCVDGKEINTSNLTNWYEKISHVPQKIFLIDGTIEENIIFDEVVLGESVDYELLKKVCEISALSELIETLPNGLNTNIGEGGAKLSGGQRQRIGIARALYRNSEILILDEATSALDTMTEKLILNAIKNHKKNITVVIVTHRTETLNWCDTVFNLDD